MEKAALRKLTIPARPQSSSFRKLTFSFIVALAFSGLAWLIGNRGDSELEPLSDGRVSAAAECWTGYSVSLGSFDEEDPTDPCHYRKLFHNALSQLKAHNESGPFQESAAIEDYMLFLSHSLDQRRQNERAILGIELGRSELARLNYAAALEHFQAAGKSLATAPELDAEMTGDLATYTAVAVYGDKPWRYARHSYERLLKEDTAWKRRHEAGAEEPGSGERLRELALSELENGNLERARTHIEAALREDAQQLGGRHYAMASNWLVSSRILTLQTKFAEARTNAERALALDSSLFGEHHPRVAQDNMVLTLLALREGNFRLARQRYEPVSAFFRAHIAAGHPGSEMNHWVQQGLNRLGKMSELADEAAGTRLEQEAWSDLNKAFAHDNPYVPRRYAELLRREAMNRP